MFFLESLFLGPTDSGGRGGDRKHIPSVHLTFIAYNHRRVWGEPGKAFLVTIVFAKVQKKQKLKKKNIKIFFFKKKK